MINNKLSEISTIIANQMYYGYSYKCDEDLPLILLSKVNTDCYNKYQLKKYKELVQILTYDCKLSSPEVTIDNTKRETWEIANPACISRKQWEKIALKICTQYKLDFIIDKIDKACDIAFDITKNIIDCEVLTSISIQNKMCELDITVDKNPAKCNAEYKLLVEKYPECNLTKKEYIYLLDTNYSFEIVSAVYNKNLQLEVDAYGNTFLVSPLNKYSLQDELKFKEIVIDSNTKDLIFPRRILDDYNITNIKKQQILNELSII